MNGSVRFLNGSSQINVAAHISLLKAYHITKLLSPYSKLWSLNTVVRAVFRPEAVLALFLRMRSKGIAKSLGKYMPIEDLLPYCGKSLSP